jgi:hypothetical protein
MASQMTPNKILFPQYIINRIHGPQIPLQPFQVQRCGHFKEIYQFRFTAKKLLRVLILKGQLMVNYDRFLS